MPIFHVLSHATMKIKEGFFKWIVVYKMRKMVLFLEKCLYGEFNLKHLLKLQNTNYLITYYLYLFLAIFGYQCANSATRVQFPAHARSRMLTLASWLI